MQITDQQQLQQLSPQEIRNLCREQKLQTQTSGLCRNFVQANLVILPEEYAQDFKLYCEKNSKPCPLIEILDRTLEALKSAKGSDIRKDLPKYKIYENGVFVEEQFDITEYCNKVNQKGIKLVGFLLGCSFTFEQALIEAGLSIRNIEENKNVPMYTTNVQTEKSGIFQGPLVVSMRPFKQEQIEKVIQITSQFPNMHGAPVNWNGNYLEELGINNINQPDYGDSVKINDDEIPVFWACGVTPQQAILKAKPSIAITHSPGHMFITDLKNSDFQQC